jgi:hypothetical protein
LTWIFSIGRFPDESNQTPIASGESKYIQKLTGNQMVLRNTQSQAANGNT